ncbi:MAG: hypothetical protein M1817_004010 [Caeruleum heppii]|nr:MAG: hypothetical protein M1817_004010 [Caeruleum heppii]
MTTWGTIKVVICTFGPFLLPRLLGYYRSFRASRSKASSSSSNGNKSPIKPVPPLLKRSLNILFLSALLFLISTLPFFASPNIFKETSSRLQIPTDVLFNRISAERPLSALEQDLQGKLVSHEARLLFLQYGPYIVAHCPFCNSDEPLSYLFYAIPTLLAPHMLHIALLGLATSAALGGPEAGRWRIQATTAGLIVAAAEISRLASYNHKLNTSAMRLSEIDFFHWRMRIFRGVILAAVDIMLAGLLYLASTGRAFVKTPSMAERLEESARALETANRKLHALGVTRNAVVRDEELRRRMVAYWDTEGKIMGQVFEEREVVDGVKGALGRLNVKHITEEAGKYAEGIIGGWQVVPMEGTAAQGESTG